MFHFETCAEVPQGGVGGGLVEVEGRVVWGGRAGVYMFNEKNGWNRWADDIVGGATLGVCGRKLVAVGGYKGGGVYSKEVMAWAGGKWSLMSGMVVGCEWSSVVSVGGGGLVVMGGVGDGGKTLADVQIFDGKTQTWHIGSSLPKRCRNMSAVVHGDLVYLMGGTGGMATAVWCANINDLGSH